MADSTLNETISEARAAALIRRPPAALRIAVIYLVARAITTGFLAIAAALSGPSSRFGADATLGSLSMGWDGQWYWYVAVNGYPATLPLNDAGDVAQNQWAFMPLYPWIANAIGAPIGQYAVGAILVSLVAGYLACLVLYRLLRAHIDDVAATWAIVFFAAGPLAALFQLGYAESLFLLWLFLSLWCVSRRRFAWLYLLIPLMGFTRPGVLAFALFLGLYGIWRWVVRRRDPLPMRQIVHIVALGLLAVIVGFSWQVIAGAVTGDPSAYLTTELSWRRDWLGASSCGFCAVRRVHPGVGDVVPTVGAAAVVRLYCAHGIRSASGLPPHLRPSSAGAGARGSSVVGELPHLPARGVLSPIEPLPTPLAAVTAVGSGSGAPVARMADRRAGGVSRRPMVVDLQHVRVGKHLHADPIGRYSVIDIGDAR